MSEVTDGDHGISPDAQFLSDTVSKASKDPNLISMTIENSADGRVIKPYHRADIADFQAKQD
jgi:hypothetical protein